MRLSYTILAVCVISLFDHTPLYSQTSDLIFSQCADTVIRLCVQDDGVRLPASNQVYLGVGHPDATRGSVHVTRSTTVSGGCGSVLNYKVELRSEDSATIIPMKPWTDVTSDTVGEATLLFDTEFSPDSVIRHAGIAYNSKCDSNYTIIWTVIDSCGMEVSCAEELHLYDCSLPLPGTFTGPYTTILPIGCFLTIFAKDYCSGSLDDYQLFSQLLFSFEQNSYTPNQTIVCPPALGVEVPYTVWIADQGEDYNCNGLIDWQERNRVEYIVTLVFIDNSGVCCEPDFGADISGQITTVPGQGVKGVEVKLHAPGHVFPTYITLEDGRYLYGNLVSPDGVQIIPSRNDFHKNGVSTLDLVKIQKHLLGRENIESPYQLIAADANKSQNVSAIDMVELRKLILGLYTVLPATDSWRFIRKDYVFEDPENPWEEMSQPFNEVETITVQVFEDLDSLDFYGIKIGDVNYTANPWSATSVLPRSISSITWETMDQQAIQGQTILVPLSLSSSASVTGFQFTVDFPGFEFVALRPGAIAISDDDYAVFDDQMTLSWFDINGINLAADEPLIYMELKALQTLNLSQSLRITSSLTEAEMYLENEETFQPLLLFEDDAVDADEFQLACNPNPWKDQTEIWISQTLEEKVYVSVFSMEGKLVWTYSETLSAGSHSIPLRSSDIQAHGPMVLEASTAHASVVQKMILLE